MIMAEDGELGLEITELRLGLPGVDHRHQPGAVEKKEKKEKKRRFDHEVVGWPPVCSYRKKKSAMKEGSKVYVKVSMDGAPFLRKIDLAMHKGYSELAMALDKLFGCMAICEGLREKKRSEHVPIYEDKDGDWMLAGDVPWEMFMESCKRLRIMKRWDAKEGIICDDATKGEDFTN